jgi:hypothetical protein
MSYFLAVAVIDKASYSSYLQTALTVVGIGGFLAATILGSIGWYNSKRPAGWEDSQTPGWVPDIKEKTKNEVESKKSV